MVRATKKCSPNLVLGLAANKIKFMQKLIPRFDFYVISHFRRLEVPVARISIFIVYFWFGFLKLLGVSPATPLVQALFEKTIWFIPFPTFYFFFSIFEMAIGILFLIRGLERVVIFLLSLHLISTALPLFLLPQITWQKFLVPTLEGQYIIKNILIAAMAVVIGAKLVPISRQSPNAKT
jgi:uncharacterized membrane protein YkgB